MEERVVGIHLAHSGGQRFATGMLVAGNLVLTALHTFVREQVGRCTDQVTTTLPAGWRLRVAVAPLGKQLGGEPRQVTWFDAQIVWPPGSASWHVCDLALIELTAPPFDLDPLAIVASNRDRLALAGRFIGFPLTAATDPGARAMPADNMPEPIDPDLHFLSARASFRGELTIHDAVENRRVFTVDDAGQAPPGISGSVVLHQTTQGRAAIVGVISAKPTQSYSALMAELGRDREDVIVDILSEALNNDETLAAMLRKHGVVVADAEVEVRPALQDHLALIDRENTCAEIASLISLRTGPGAGTKPRGVVTVGYVGDDAPRQAIEAIKRKLPPAIAANARRRRLAAPPVVVRDVPLVLSPRTPRLLPEDVNELMDSLDGGLGGGPAVVLQPVIVSGEITASRQAAACLTEIGGLLDDLATYAAPIILLVFLERDGQTAEGVVVHERLRADAASRPQPALGALEFLGDLEWIDEHAIAQWGTALLRDPNIMRWSHIVKRHVSDLETRVFQLHRNCPENARVYPRLRRVAELIAEIQSSTLGTKP
ncbi:hypothetical protein [Xanthobacter wiegelii]|uniref:hypothetical protein n=1 Tax=Xanthobacter wiegelii TaxID=3119913 RepID=UPI003729CDAC